jgi:hypothetical protein
MVRQPHMDNSHNAVLSVFEPRACPDSMGT